MERVTKRATGLFLLACIVAASLLTGVESRPQNGVFRNLMLKVDETTKDCPLRCSQHCANLVMMSGSPISITINKVEKGPLESNEDSKVSARAGDNTKIHFFMVIYKSQCADINQQMCTNDKEFFQHVTPLGWYSTNLLPSSPEEQTIKMEELTLDNFPVGFGKVRSKSSRDEPPATTATTATTIGDANNANSTNEPDSTYTTNLTTVYVVLLAANYSGQKPQDKAVYYTVSVTVEMKNSYGYLSLVDYPALIVFSILLVLYVILGFIWLILLACFYKDLVQLQFWILAVIILGFLEKVFFVAEYSTANEGMESWGLIYIAEGVSAAKRALSRMLLIIVCEGFGTVKPRLGNTLHSVVAIGVVYFVVAFIDGIVRGVNVTTHHQELLPLLATGLLILVDLGVIYWIFSALVNTRRQLRLRKNFVKISLYNHLAYTLLFAIIASLAFLIWWVIELSSSACVMDWKEVWLKDCFWHMLFCLILVVIMIIWRPAANSKRFAYSLVLNNDEDEEDEQGPNKNFENLKMRTVPKPEPTKPVMSAETEEDLKWVEENLPTTTLDKGLSLVMDSEEEDMTTMFEMSKKD